MEKIRSESERRLIVEGQVNGKKAYFLIDTGASVGIVDYDRRKEYGLVVGRRYNGTIIGAGGEMRNVRHCDTFAYIRDRVIPQFLLADITGIVDSVMRETGIGILGIISLPQMKMAGISLDCNDNLIILE